MPNNFAGLIAAGFRMNTNTAGQIHPLLTDYGAGKLLSASAG